MNDRLRQAFAMSLTSQWWSCAALTPPYLLRNPVRLNAHQRDDRHDACASELRFFVARASPSARPGIAAGSCDPSPAPFTPPSYCCWKSKSVKRKSVVPMLDRCVCQTEPQPESGVGIGPFSVHIAKRNITLLGDPGAGKRSLSSKLRSLPAVNS